MTPDDLEDSHEKAIKLMNQFAFILDQEKASVGEAMSIVFGLYALTLSAVYDMETVHDISRKSFERAIDQAKEIRKEAKEK